MREHWNKEDFIGFAYNGIHSSQFGLVSVTTNNRYQRALLADIQDVTTTIAGRDGVLYYGTNRGKKTFPFSLAFDGLMEDEYLGLAAWLQVESGELILDERPYVKYNVKLAIAPVIEFVPFTDEYGRRVYKGELNISFVCYEGYGYCVEKWADNYSTTGFTGDYAYNPLMVTHTGAEWKTASRLRANKMFGSNQLDTWYDAYIANNINTSFQFIYDPGDVCCDWNIILNVEQGPSTSAICMAIYKISAYIQPNLNLAKENRLGWLKLQKPQIDQNNSSWVGRYQIDSKKRIVLYQAESDQKWTPSLNLWVGGDFFQFPVSSNKDEIYMFVIFGCALENDDNDEFRGLEGIDTTSSTLTYNYKYY